MKLEINNTTKSKIDSRLLKKAAQIFGRNMKQGGKEASLAIVGDQRIKTLNRLYRKKDKITDVLSFRSNEKNNFLGEIIICYPQIKRQAKRQGIPLKDELVFIFIHGLLHLIGYDDKKQKDYEKMMKIGKKLCKSMV